MFRPCALGRAAALVGFLATSAQAMPILEQTTLTGDGDVTFGASYTTLLSEDLDIRYTTADPRNLVYLVGNDSADEVAAVDEVAAGVAIEHGDTILMLSDVVAPVAGAGVSDAIASDTLASIVAGTDAVDIGAIDGSVLPAAVDEPSTLLMLGSGLSMLVAAMRRRSKA